MEELIRSLYYMVEDWVGQHDLMDKEIKALETRQDDLQNEIILRLGEDGQDMMEALSDLTLRLETIHDQALFRAAMGLGTQIAQPVGAHTVRPPLCTPLQRADNVRPYSTSL